MHQRIAAIGYASETAFSQAFKRHHGTPPHAIAKKVSCRPQGGWPDAE